MEETIGAILMIALVAIGIWIALGPWPGED
jgi:hypothetical protein